MVIRVWPVLAVKYEGVYIHIRDVDRWVGRWVRHCGGVGFKSRNRAERLSKDCFLVKSGGMQKSQFSHNCGSIHNCTYIPPNPMSFHKLHSQLA